MKLDARSYVCLTFARGREKRIASRRSLRLALTRRQRLCEMVFGRSWLTPNTKVFGRAKHTAREAKSKEQRAKSKELRTLLVARTLSCALCTFHFALRP